MGGDYYRTRLIGTPNNRSQVDAIIVIILRNDIAKGIRPEEGCRLIDD